jgi:branched-chain amino acid aminotransferase
LIKRINLFIFYRIKTKSFSTIYIPEEMNMELTITRAEQLKSPPDDSDLSFGTIFTDHMFNMDFEPDRGWHNPRIEPYSPFEMDPATMILHYGQGIFEGLKAYRNKSGGIQLFRPKENFKRINRSARALCIPEIDEEFGVDALKQLLSIEKHWVPSSPETSLYIRPTIIATDPFLGLRSSFTYRFFIILSPVGAYYPEGFNPVKIWVTNKHVRAVRGGLGAVKTPGNYAASLFATEEAHKNGYTQVLWLDGVELQYVEEVGAMNIFFIIDDELISPALQGSILPGITRDSVLSLAKYWGMNVTERKISINEVFDAHASGKLQEVFGSGTAAVISPVGEIKYEEKNIIIHNGTAGSMSQKFYTAITDIQYGNVEDSMGWIELV